MNRTCTYCGTLHQPVTANNNGEPVCAVCATALLRLCPTPLFTAEHAALLVWPRVQPTERKEARDATNAR
jgi:hypothetical protein